MEESIKIIQHTEEVHSGIRHGRILNEDVQLGKCFESFVDRQKSKGITAQGVANLREETMDILAHCNPHDAIGNDETTHLVVGYVQSGKTMSFTGLGTRQWLSNCGVFRRNQVEPFETDLGAFGERLDKVKFIGQECLQDSQRPYRG